MVAAAGDLEPSVVEPSSLDEKGGMTVRLNDGFLRAVLDQNRIRRVVMRKKISVVVAVAVLSTLAACGGGEESDKQSPDSTEVLVKNRPRNSKQITVSGG